MPPAEGSCHQVPPGKKRRPEDRRADRRRRLRVARARRREQLRFVGETKQRVVVREVNVVVEGERTQVCEVVEPVALQTRPELQLTRQPHGEERGKDQRRPVPARSAMDAGRPRDDNRDKREDQQQSRCSGLVTSDAIDDRAAGDLSSAQFQDRGARGEPGDGVQQPRPGVDRRRQGTTLKIRNSAPGTSGDGEIRLISRLCPKMRMYSAYSR